MWAVTRERSRAAAVGLVEHRPGDSELQRSMRRVELAFQARVEGFLLTETFELEGRPERDRPTLREVERFLRQNGTDVLIVHGAIDDDLVQPLADRRGVRLVVVTPPPPLGAA